MKMIPGEIVWQLRLPGGFCIFLEEEKSECEDVYNWLLFHPKEGLICDADFYYERLHSEKDKHYISSS